MEIKFRYYLKTINGRIYREELDIKEIESGLAREFYKCIKRVQFTGLLDKNGKEIYEGDIVLVTPNGWIDKEHECESCKQYEFEVKYILDGKEIRCQPLSHSHREVEIVGNVYKNNK